MMEIKDGKIHVNILGIDVLMEEKENKVYLYCLDIENAKNEIVAWETVVNKYNFELCVEMKEEVGYENARESTIADYALRGTCAWGRYQ